MPPTDSSADAGYLVACIVEGFLDESARSSRWAARAVRMPDPMLRAVVDAWAGSRGGTVGEWATDEPRHVELIAIEANIEAASAEQAIEVGRDFMRPLMLALAYRQLRPGRALAWMAHSLDGTRSIMRHENLDPPKVYHGAPGDAAWSQAVDIAEMAHAIQASPSGEHLVGLFQGAIADSSVDGMVARLWSLLEVLAERFRPLDGPRCVQRTVEAALAHIGLAGQLNVDEAYRCRNGFVHEGSRAEAATIEPIRSQLVRVVYTSLARSGFRTIDPESPPLPAESQPEVRREIVRSSLPRPRPRC